MVFGILHVTAAGLRIVNLNLDRKTLLKLPPHIRLLYRFGFNFQSKAGSSCTFSSQAPEVK